MIRGKPARPKAFRPLFPLTLGGTLKRIIGQISVILVVSGLNCPRKTGALHDFVLEFSLMIAYLRFMSKRPAPASSQGDSLPPHKAGKSPKILGRWGDRSGNDSRSRLKSVLVFALFAATLGAGVWVGRASLKVGVGGGGGEATEGKVVLRPGPWGDLEYLPITIVAPQEILKVKDTETRKLRWYFEGTTPQRLAQVLQVAGISDEQRARLMSPSVLSAQAAGVTLDPVCETLAELDEPVLAALYGQLALSPMNAPARWELLARHLETFGEYGVSSAATKQLRRFSVPNGRFLVNYAMPCVFRAIPDRDEKAGMLQALTQQQSMLLRLKVTPQTNVDALMNYWGKAIWATNVKAILESLKKRPDGGAVELTAILPPFPVNLLHTFPIPHNTLKGPEVVKNCSWTAFNFFRDEPDSEFTHATYVVKKLQDDYVPVNSDPRYGDIAVFLNAQQQMVHVAVYLADDVYFTKNGENPWHPWVFSTEGELLESFSFGLPADKPLTISYFRNKYL